MRQADRLARILEQVSKGKPADVGDLAAALGVSSSTIRRDLERLEQQHLLARTHGGAVATQVAYELPLRYRSIRSHKEKARIAQAAVARMGGVGVVGLTGGTTTTEIARALAERTDLTIVTNALNIAAEIAMRPNLKLVVTGGVVRSSSYELVGPFAEETLARMNLDLAFIGVDGVSGAGGLTTHHEGEAQINAALIRRAKRSIAVADGSKLGIDAFARICAVAEVDEVITTAEEPAQTAHLRALRAAGVVVSVV